MCIIHYSKFHFLQVFIYRYQGGGKIIFPTTLLVSLVGALYGGLTRQIKKRKTHTFNINSIWHRNLYKEMTSLWNVKPEFLYWVWQKAESGWKMIDKKVEWRVINGGKFRPVLLDSSWHPSVFRDKDAPFFWVQGRHLLQDGLMTCFR